MSIKWLFNCLLCGFSSLALTAQIDSSSLPILLSDPQHFTEAEETIEFDQWDVSSSEKLTSETKVQLDSISSALGADLFLSSRLRKHINRYGIPLSKLEIEALNFLTKEEKDRILKIHPKRFRNLLRPKRSFSKTRGKIWLRWSRRLSDLPEGYFKSLMDYPGSAYHGSPDHFLIRTKVQNGRTISAALCLEKDAGETWNQNGFDHWSGYLNFRPQNSWLEEVILGSFQIQAAQGLTLWSGSKLQFQNSLAEPMKYSRGIVPYSGSMEMLQLKGIAARARFRHWRLEGFYSHQYLNSRIDNEKPQSIDVSGLNRTSTQLSRKSALEMNFSGMYLRYSRRHQRIGIIYKRETLSPTHSIREDALNSVGLEYLLNLPRFRLFGELSLKERHSYSYLVGGKWDWHESSSLGFSLHHSPAEFYSLSSPLLDYGNSKGLQELQILSSTAFEKIRVFASIIMQNNLKRSSLRTPRNIRQKTQLGLEWRVARNINYVTTIRTQNSIAPVANSRTQWSNIMKWSPSSFLQFKTGVSIHGQDVFSDQSGILLSQGIKYITHNSLKLGLQFSSFTIETYDHRIYAYQNDVSQSLSIPAYYGTGYEINTTIQKTMAASRIEIRYTFRHTKGKTKRQELRVQFIQSF